MQAHALIVTDGTDGAEALGPRQLPPSEDLHCWWKSRAKISKDAFSQHWKIKRSLHSAGMATDRSGRIFLTDRFCTFETCQIRRDAGAH